MSRKFDKISSKFGGKKGAVAGVALAAIVGLGIAPASGAYFSASDNGRATVTMATLSVDLGDPAHGYEGTFHANFDNLAPGQTGSQVFYVKNTGSIPATVSLKQNVQSFNGGPDWPTDVTVRAAEVQKLKTAVEGYSGWTRAYNQALNANLGVLQPGESRAYTLLFALDSDAGNMWQGLEVGANVVITLDQLQ